MKAAVRDGPVCTNSRQVLEIQQPPQMHRSVRRTRNNKSVGRHDLDCLDGALVMRDLFFAGLEELVDTLVLEIDPRQVATAIANDGEVPALGESNTSSRV